jgi:FixJ family two-component response regulator
MTAPLSQVPAGATVSIVDDDETVRHSLARVLKSARIQTETFASADAYLSHATPEGPSCILLDLQMPGLNGLELQETLATRGAPIVFVTGHGDVPTCAKAMKAGAIDFLSKPVDADDLLRAVSSALTRSVEMRRARAERAAARALLEKLTPREFEVMRHVIAGLLNKQIADDLGASEKTIKIHRGRLMAKMGVTSVADLVRAAQAAGVY